MTLRATLRSLLFTVGFYVSTADVSARRQLAFLGSALVGHAGSSAARALLHMVPQSHMRHAHGGTWRRKAPRGACLVVSKHQSAWDTFALIPIFRDPAIVLKEELKWIPFYGWFCLKFEHILVRRERAAVALKQMLADAKDRAAQGREVFIFPEGTRRPPGAEPDYKPGYVALYEGLGLPCYPVALNSGLYWPRRTLQRYPGTIIVEILDPIPPGLPRTEFRRRLENSIEAAADRLLLEASESLTPPPIPQETTLKLRQIKLRT